MLTKTKGIAFMTIGLLILAADAGFYLTRAFSEVGLALLALVFVCGLVVVVTGCMLATGKYENKKHR